MDDRGEKVRVAVACQGDGSHTAFTAGALKRLLADERYEVVALSGTSGGAICAVLAWYALLENGGAGRAAQLLVSFWRDNSARGLLDAFWNEWFLWVNRSQGSFVLPAISPYDTQASDWAQNRLRAMLTDHVKFGKIPSLLKDSSPMLLIYRHIDIRWIRMSISLDFASKLDRSPSFIRRLMDYGERRAEDFLEQQSPVPSTGG